MAPSDALSAPAWPRRLRIGDWRADAAANTLRRGDKTVRIEPKAMETLMALAARAGDVVGRDELLAAVWPGVVVVDEALTQSIIKLRRALDDNPRAPRYIETISKRGYRLIAAVCNDVATSDDAAVADEIVAASAAAAPPRPPTRRRVTWLVALAVLAGIAFAAAVHVLRTDRLSPPPEETKGSAPEATTPTIAVLAFEAWGDGDPRAVARGIRQDLMTDLAQLPGVRLVRAAGATADASSVPGARFLIAGSVQRAADMLRINVRLLEAPGMRQLWSERYEKPSSDLLAMQDEMTRRLLEALPAKIAEAARERAASRYTRSLDAYDAFLRGQALLLVRQVADNDEARAYFRKALDLDPNFARAYAGLALTYAMDPLLRQSRGNTEALTRALELAQTARQIDPDLPEALWTIAFVQAQGRRHAEAIRSLERAIGMNGSYADAYALLGGVYTYVGQPAKSIPLLRTALRLNPDGGYLYFLLLGRAYLFESDTEQALINLREASERNPADLETHLYLAAALSAAGERAEAEWQAEEVRALDDGFVLSRWLDRYPMTSAAQRERLVVLLAPAGL